MIKNILLIVALLGATTLFGAGEGKKNKKMMVHDLINVPFPGGKLFKKGIIKLSDEQKKRLQNEVQPIMHGKYNPMVQEIFLLEKKIQRGVIKKASKVDEKMQEQLAKIAQLKQEAMGYKIEALLKLKSIFTKEQWQVWVSH